MAKATIIVPIYNVEKYLMACFDSLLKQDPEDAVILAVNDGSPDNSRAIIEEYRTQYPERIRFIDKENGGYGSVLELAIHQLDTPYFLVCDPDDTITEDAVKTLLALAEKHGADIAVGAKNFVYNGTDRKDYDTAYNTAFVSLMPDTVYRRGTEAFNDLLFLDPSPHAKLYRKETAQDIVFLKKVGYTDNMLFYLSLLKADKVVYTDRALADYLVDRPGNTMTDVSVKAMRGQISVFSAIVEQASRIQDVPDIFWYRMFESFKYMLWQTRRVKGSEEERSLILDELYGFVRILVPYRSEILPWYSKYSTARFLEKKRDRDLLDERRSERAFAVLKKKMMQGE